MSDLCADPACAQIREWYLADEVKLAKIRAEHVHVFGPGFICATCRILDGEPAS